MVRKSLRAIGYVWLAILAGQWLPAQLVKAPTVVQRERNPFPNSAWAISNRGQLLISSNSEGTFPHLWTANRFVTNPPLDSTTFDYVNYVRDTDTLVVASAETLRRHRKFMNLLSDELVGFLAEFIPSNLTVDPKSEAFQRGVERGFLKRLQETGMSKPPLPLGKANKDTFDIRLYQTEGKKAVKPFATIEASNQVEWFAVSGDGSRIALYSPSSNIIEVATIREGFNTPNKRFKDVLYPTKMYDMLVSSKGGQLLVAQQARVSLISLENGEMLQSLAIDPEYVDVQFAYGGRYLVARDVKNQKAIVTELKSGRELTFDIDKEDRVAVTPDGQWLVQLCKSDLKFTKLANRSETYTELLHDDCNKNCQMVFASGAGRMIIWSDEPQRLYVVNYPFASK